MDRDWGAKTGGGGVASGTNSNVDRRERLRKLAMETIDLNRDPYFMRNHLGSYDCRLCFTMHTNEGNYLAHTQGRRHQTNLAKREASIAKETPTPAMLAKQKQKQFPQKTTVKIGRPGYRVTKQRDPETDQLSLLFQIEFPEVEEGFLPRHRFMSAYEQRVDQPDRKYQYLLFAAEPYETIAFKIPNREIEPPGKDGPNKRYYTNWDREKHVYTLQLYFKNQSMGPQDMGPESLPPMPNTAPMFNPPPGSFVPLPYPPPPQNYFYPPL